MFLVEKCELYRMGIERTLRQERSLVVAGSCKETAQARDWLGVQKADCVVVGMSADAKCMEALKLIKWIKSTTPKVALVILTDGSDPDCMQRVLRAGVRTILLRSVPPETLTSTILKVLAGREYIDTTLSRDLLGHLFVSKPVHAVDPGRLTDREVELLEILASGVSTSTISTKLGLAQRTVNIHLKRMRKKLGAQNSRELLVKAVRWQCSRGLDATQSGTKAVR